MDAEAWAREWAEWHLRQTYGDDIDPGIRAAVTPRLVKAARRTTGYKARRIAELRRQGLSDAAIAAKVGLGRSTVGWYLSRMGDDVHPEWIVGLDGKRRRAVQASTRVGAGYRRQMVADLRRQGLPTRAIAAKLGISQPAVLRHLRKLGDDWQPDWVVASDGRLMRAVIPERRGPRTAG